MIKKLFFNKIKSRNIIHKLFIYSNKYFILLINDENFKFLPLFLLPKKNIIKINIFHLH